MKEREERERERERERDRERDVGEIQRQRKIHKSIYR